MLYVHNKNVLYITDTTVWVFLLVSGFTMLWMEARVLHVLDTCSTTETLTQNSNRREQEVLERAQWEGARGRVCELKAALLPLSV